MTLYANPSQFNAFDASCFVACKAFGCGITLYFNNPYRSLRIMRFFQAQPSPHTLVAYYFISGIMMSNCGSAILRTIILWYFFVADVGMWSVACLASNGCGSIPTPLTPTLWLVRSSLFDITLTFVPPFLDGCP